MHNLNKQYVGKDGGVVKTNLSNLQAMNVPKQPDDNVGMK